MPDDASRSPAREPRERLRAGLLRSLFGWFLAGLALRLAFRLGGLLLAVLGVVVLLRTLLEPALVLVLLWLVYRRMRGK